MGEQADIPQIAVEESRNKLSVRKRLTGLLRTINDRIHQRVPETTRTGVDQFTAVEEAIRHPLPEAFRGQRDLTIAELGAADAALANNEGFKLLFENAEPRQSDLADTLEVLVAAASARFPEVHIPLFHPDIRAVVKRMFSTTVKWSGSTEYQIMGGSGIYGLLHRNQTQSMPIGLHVDFAQVQTVHQVGKPGGLERFAGRIPGRFGEKVRNLLNAGDQSLIVVDKKLLASESKWRPNDLERRIQISQELHQFASERVQKDPNPNQKFIILEPGGGNGEGSVRLAEMLADDPSTRDRVTIVVREYSTGMISEGRAKVEMLNKKREQQNKSPIDIEFVGGSAISPFRDQLADLNRLASSTSTQNLIDQLSRYDSLSPAQLDTLKNQQRIIDEFATTPEDGLELINKLNGRQVIAASTTYTLGAMSTESDPRASIAVKIAAQMRLDVEPNGRVIIDDFAERPTDAHIDTFTPEVARQTSKARDVYDTFATVGFAQNLADIYAFWGAAADSNGIGHDVKQIWFAYDLFLRMDKAAGSHNATQMSAELQCFSLLPRAIRKDKVICTATPGYFDGKITTTGIGLDTPIKI